MTWAIVGVGAVNVSATASITPAVPAGARAGDLLVAIVAYRGSGTLGLPTGWTQIENQNSGNTATDTTGIASITLAYTIHTGSTPANTFTRGTGIDVASGRIIAYRASDSRNIAEPTVSSSETMASSGTALSTPSITTTTAEELIVVGAAGGDNVNLTNIDADTDPATGTGTGTTTDAVTAPTAGTWRYRALNTSTTGADTTNVGADAVRATAGATGTIRATAAGSARHALAAAAFKEVAREGMYREATSVTSGNLTLLEPFGAAEGDLLVAMISYRDTAAFTLPSGWTLIEEDSNGNTTTGSTASKASLLMAYIVRGASAPDYVFTRTGGNEAWGVVHAYPGPWPANPLVASSKNVLGANSTTTSTGTITVGTGDLLVAFIAGARNSTDSGDFAAATAPTGSSGRSEDEVAALSTTAWTKRTEIASIAAGGGGIASADAEMASAGATGQITGFWGLSALHGMAVAGFTRTSGPAGYTLTAEAGSVAVTGTAASLERGAKVAAEAGSVAITGTTASLEAGRKVAADAGAVSITGTAASLEAGRNLSADPGSVAAIGTGATLRAARKVTADAGSVLVSGTDATLVYTPVGSYTLVADAGSFTITGPDATLRRTYVMPADAGEVSITGTAAALTYSGAEPAPEPRPRDPGGDDVPPVRRRPQVRRYGRGFRPIYAVEEAVETAEEVLAITNAGERQEAAEAVLQAMEPVLGLLKPALAPPDMSPVKYETPDDTLRAILAAYRQWLEDDDEDVIALLVA